MLCKELKGWSYVDLFIWLKSWSCDIWSCNRTLEDREVFVRSNMEWKKIEQSRRKKFVNFIKERKNSGHTLQVPNTNTYIHTYIYNIVINMQSVGPTSPAVNAMCSNRSSGELINDPCGLTTCSDSVGTVDWRVSWCGAAWPSDQALNNGNTYLSSMWSVSCLNCRQTYAYIQRATRVNLVLSITLQSSSFPLSSQLSVWIGDQSISILN